MIALVFERSFLHIRTLIYYAYCCKCVKSYRKCVAFKTHIDLQATLQTARFVTSCWNTGEGVQSSVTKRDEGGLFFP